MAKRMALNDRRFGIAPQSRTGRIKGDRARPTRQLVEHALLHVRGGRWARVTDDLRAGMDRLGQALS